MARLAYYASRIAPDKPHQLETIAGVRIYTAVPICRTGYQEYAGKELKGHPDYDPAWNIGDDEIVKVYRPKSVVTAPETVASFEGVSVLDNHPPRDVAIVTVENEAEYGKGHAQNLRVGPELEDGDISILADLFVKDQPLNDKIDDGVRDVSCGYIFGMTRADDGTLIMTKIIGNHVAVVPKGRAGPEVAIQDSASVVEDIRQPKPERKEGPMAKDKETNFWGRMLKLLAASDAAPEDLEKVAKAAKDEDKVEEEKKEPAKDSEPEKKEEKDEYDLHPDLKTACDHIAHMRTAMDAMSEHFGIGKEKKEDEEEKPKEEEASMDADVLELFGEEKGKTELPKQIAGDTAEFLKLIKPVIAASKNKQAIGQFNAMVRGAKAAATAIDANPYAGLAHTSSPHEARIDEVDPAQFFNGVTYAEGLRKFNEHKAKKGNK